MRCRVSPVIAFLVLVPGSALSQTAPFIIDRSRPDRAPAMEAPAQKPVPRAVEGVEAKTVKPFVLKSVDIPSTSAPKALAAAIRPFIGKTVGARDIAAIAEAVSEAYAKNSDIALYTVVVPDQDFAKGVLVLDVFEGYVEHVDVKGDVEDDTGLIVAYAKRLTAEKPLKRSTLERMIALMRDIPGLTLDVQLLKGDAPGAVRMVLTLKQKRFAVAWSGGDRGNPTLGRVQLEADLSLYHVLREGDQTKLTLAVPTDAGKFQYAGLTEMQPVGDDGVILQASYGFLRTEPSLPYPRGQAQTYQLLAAWPLLRGNDENIFLSASFDGIDSKNAVLGALVSNDHVRTVRFSASYNVQDPRQAFAANASLSKGLGILGAESISKILSDPQFGKATAQVSYNRLLGASFVVRLRASGQYAWAVLPSSEMFALGGDDFGRAFPVASAIGDTAVAGSAQLGYLPKIAFLPHLELYAFVDDGNAWTRARGPYPAYDEHLASAGGGFSVQLDPKTGLRIEAANGIGSNLLAARPGGWEFGFLLTRTP